MKTILKHIVEWIAVVAVSPAHFGYALSLLFMGSPSAIQGWSQLMSLFPGTAGIFLRRAFYRYVFPACGRDSCISFGTVFSHPTARIGDRAYIGVGCMIGDVTLEEDVLVGSHVSIINGRGQHGTSRLDIPVREQPGEYPRVTIGRDTWIGDRAIVTESVGQHCIVGAGAVVTKPVPDFAIVVGNPARIQGFRQSSDGSAGLLEIGDECAVEPAVAIDQKSESK